MQPDNAAASTQTSSNSFDAYYIRGFTIFSQVRGTLTITNDALTMVDEQQSVLFNLPKASVSRVRDDLSQIRIFTSDKKYTVSFRDTKKGAARLLLVGPLLGGGGKNGVFAANPQEQGRLVIDCLNRCGYNAPYNKHRPS